MKRIQMPSSYAVVTEEEKEQVRAQLVYAGVPVPRLGNEYKSWQVYVKEV